MAETGSKLTRLSDIELIDMALKQNSQAAFFALHSRYKNGLRNHVSKYVQDPQDIEDICIVSFQKAFKELASYKPQNKFSTWLYTIARNTAFDHQNKEIVRGKLDRTDFMNENNEQIDIADDTINPEENIINGQDHDLLMNSIDSLPEHYKIVARMCYVDNLGYKEIAEKADIPINTVKTRISRAKELLIKKMQDIEE